MSPVLAEQLLFGEQFWWYVARSGGIVALVLSGASVVWGLLLGTKYLGRAAKPKRLLDLHRFLGALTVIFTAIHMIALVFDEFVTFTLTDLLVPFASEWQPANVAWGVVSFWLLIAIQLSSMLMNRIPRRLWRGIHFSSYLMFLTGLVHGLLAGTDASSPVFLLGMGGLVGLITLLTGWRVLGIRTSMAARPATAAAVSVGEEPVGAARGA